MNRDEMLAELQEAFRKAFMAPRLEITPETTSVDIDGWDSLSHVRLLLEVEKRFGIDIDGEQGTRLKNVGELLDMLARLITGDAHGRP